MRSKFLINNEMKVHPLFKITMGHPLPFYLMKFWVSLFRIILGYPNRHESLDHALCCPHIDYAFASVVHIGREVDFDWLLRTLLANRASLGFSLFGWYKSTFVYKCYSFTIIKYT